MTALVGHDEPWREWRAGMASGRMHHAWILAGMQGLGKASFARAAARELVAEPGVPQPAQHPDIVVLEPLPASEDDARTLADTLVADSGFGPVRQLQSREQAAALIAAVEQLPLEQREVFLLQAEGDLSVQEIAEATGVNFETAKSRLRYARASYQHQQLELQKNY